MPGPRSRCTRLEADTTLCPPNDAAKPSDRLTHLADDGSARMVDVGWKPVTDRMAQATGQVVMQPETLALIRDGLMKKGDVLTIAQLAGIMGAKRTSELIPLCHPLPDQQGGCRA